MLSSLPEKLQRVYLSLPHLYRLSSSIKCRLGASKINPVREGRVGFSRKITLVSSNMTQTRLQSYTPTHFYMLWYYWTIKTELAFHPHIRTSFAQACASHLAKPGQSHKHRKARLHALNGGADKQRNAWREDGANGTSAHISQHSIEIGQERVNWPSKSKIVKWGFSFCFFLPFLFLLCDSKVWKGKCWNWNKCPTPSQKFYICLHKICDSQFILKCFPKDHS